MATGSGFWGLEGGLTVLYPTDPAIMREIARKLPDTRHNDWISRLSSKANCGR